MKHTVMAALIWTLAAVFPAEARHATRDISADLPYPCGVIKAYASMNGITAQVSPAKRKELRAQAREHGITPRQQRAIVSCLRGGR